MAYTYTNEAAKGDFPFGLSLMRHMGCGNIVMSPLSIRYALAMLYEGAREETASEIASVANLPVDAATRHEGFRTLTSILNASNAPFTLRCANGVWVAENQQYPIKPAYREALTTHYKAKVEPADFERNAAEEAAKINAWCSNITAGRIPVLFDSIDPLTALVIANALYFKAEWYRQFNPQNTKQENFYLSNGTPVKVDMMEQGRVDTNDLPNFLYKQFNGFQAAVLPYKCTEHGKLEKMILLPDKGVDVRTVEQHLLEKKISIAGLYSRLSMTDFECLKIPKHEARGEYDLVALLRATGIAKVFDERQSDLTGISDEKPLFVSRGNHKTFIKHDEKGSEGAAASAFVLSRLGRSESVEFIADRPYLELILFNQSHVLFLNRIEEPR